VFPLYLAGFKLTPQMQALFTSTNHPHFSCFFELTSTPSSCGSYFCKLT